MYKDHSSSIIYLRHGFYDNESEIISGESELLCRCGTIDDVQAILMSLSPHRGCSAYSRAALINFFVPDVALIRGRRSYSSKYGSSIYRHSDEKGYCPRNCWDPDRAHKKN